MERRALFESLWAAVAIESARKSAREVAQVICFALSWTLAMFSEQPARLAQPLLAMLPTLRGALALPNRTPLEC